MEHIPKSHIRWKEKEKTFHFFLCNKTFSSKKKIIILFVTFSLDTKSKMEKFLFTIFISIVQIVSYNMSVKVIWLACFLYCFSCEYFYLIDDIHASPFLCYASCTSKNEIWIDGKRENKREKLQIHLLCSKKNLCMK